MGLYLTIPDVVESEELHSVSPAPDGVTFTISLDHSNTVVQLMQANANGQHIPLVVLTTDAMILALDSVYVTEISIGTQGSPTVVTFLAQAVRFV